MTSKALPCFRVCPEVLASVSHVVVIKHFMHQILISLKLSGQFLAMSLAGVEPATFGFGV